MPRYTMFQADGIPLRAKVHVSTDGWRFTVTLKTNSLTPPYSPAHELTHVVQQREMSSWWLHPRNGGTRLSGAPRPGAALLPEVNDEVMISFEHGDRRHAILFVQPASSARATKIDSFVIKQKASESNVAVFDFGPGKRRAVCFHVEAKGRTPFSILGGTAPDSEFRGGVSAVSLFGGA